MPLADGEHQKMLSGKISHMQDDASASRYSGQTDSVDLHQVQTGRQNPNIALGADSEDISLRQNSPSQEQIYDSEEQKNVYQPQERAFNEQCGNYTGKISYNCEILMGQIPKMTENKHANSIHTHINANNASPPSVPGTNPDSELDLSKWAQRMMDVNGRNIALLECDCVENSQKRERLQTEQPSVKKYSIKEGRRVEKELSEHEYRKQHRDAIRKSEKRERHLESAKRTGRLLFNDENIAEDEDITAVKRTVHKAAYVAKRRIKRNIQDIRDQEHVYRRLKFNDAQNSLISKEGRRLKHEQGRILASNRKMEVLDEMNAKSVKNSAVDGRETARRAENRKIQQQKRQRQRIARQQNHISKKALNGRDRHQYRMYKISVKEQRIVRRRNMTVISSIISFITIMLVLLLAVFLFIMAFLSIFAHIEVQTVTQNDYTVLTDVTEYLRDQEANLKDLVDGSGREKLEKDLDDECIMQTGMHLYEFIYDLPDFGFDDLTLMAYLSAKFFSFDLQTVQADLDEIFSLMYQIDIELNEEERTFYDENGNPYTQEVMVCYIKVEKTELEEVVEARLDTEALELYKLYKLSGGGQQVYGPVLDGIDWSGKISSAFGERVHPITGKKTFHNGVDIAVPIGTKLYSAVTGTVISAYYSDSGGNMVTVKTDSGWEVTYMHMDSISVRAGQTVLKGQFVGCSGNTGNSTGPHLHIRVHDADDRKINPIFIIPQSGNIYNK